MENPEQKPITLDMTEPGIAEAMEHLNVGDTLTVSSKDDSTIVLEPQPAAADEEQTDEQPSPDNTAGEEPAPDGGADEAPMATSGNPAVDRLMAKKDKE
jgi:hypothetical protein